MKELSIFIDESGDFGMAKEYPSYYLVTFVFHNQENCIDEQVSKLEESVRNSGFHLEYIHTGPVIRKEEVFAGHMTVAIDRREAADKITLSGKLAKEINRAMSFHAK